MKLSEAQALVNGALIKAKKGEFLTEQEGEIVVLCPVALRRLEWCPLREAWVL